MPPLWGIISARKVNKTTPGSHFIHLTKLSFVLPIVGDSDKELTYDDLQSMTYVDQIIRLLKL